MDDDTRRKRISDMIGEYHIRDVRFRSSLFRNRNIVIMYEYYNGSIMEDYPRERWCEKKVGVF